MGIEWGFWIEISKMVICCGYPQATTMGIHGQSSGNMMRIDGDTTGT